MSGNWYYIVMKMISDSNNRLSSAENQITLLKALGGSGGGSGDGSNLQGLLDALE